MKKLMFVMFVIGCVGLFGLCFVYAGEKRAGNDDNMRLVYTCYPMDFDDGEYTAKVRLTDRDDGFVVRTYSKDFTVKGDAQIEIPTPVSMSEISGRNLVTEAEFLNHETGRVYKGENIEWKALSKEEQEYAYRGRMRACMITLCLAWGVLAMMLISGYIRRKRIMPIEQIR